MGWRGCAGRIDARLFNNDVCIDKAFSKPVRQQWAPSLQCAGVYRARQRDTWKCCPPRSESAWCLCRWWFSKPIVPHT